MQAALLCSQSCGVADGSQLPGSVRSSRCGTRRNVRQPPENLLLRTRRDACRMGVASCKFLSRRTRASLAGFRAFLSLGRLGRPSLRESLERSGTALYRSQLRSAPAGRGLKAGSRPLNSECLVAPVPQPRSAGPPAEVASPASQGNSVAKAEGDRTSGAWRARMPFPLTEHQHALQSQFC